MKWGGISNVRLHDPKPKVIFKNIHYDVMENKVLCGIKAFIRMPYGDLVRPDDNRMLIYAESTVTCSPEDTFDAELGKKIARTKAENKIYDKAAAMVFKFETELMAILNSLGVQQTEYNVKIDENAFLGKLGKYFSHNKEYLKELNTKVVPKKKDIKIPEGWKCTCDINEKGDNKSFVKKIYESPHGKITFEVKNEKEKYQSDVQLLKDLDNTQKLIEEIFWYLGDRF